MGVRDQRSQAGENDSIILIVMTNLAGSIRSRPDSSYYESLRHNFSLIIHNDHVKAL